MVNGQIAINYFLQVLADVAETEVQALKGLELRGYACGESADRYVADVAEEMLDADFLGLFRFYY